MSVLIQGTQVPVTADGLASGNVSSTPGTSLELHAVRARNHWWNVVQDTQFNSSDAGVSLVYDSMGNMYVYGLVQTSQGNGTLALKFNPEGYLQWRKSYTDANGFACGGNDAIAIDSNDNLYFMANDSVTSVFYAGTMDLEGNISPTYISLTGGAAYDLAVDNAANMYFTGGLTNTGNGQGFVAKVNSSSNTLVWTTSLAAANPSFGFAGTAVAAQGSNVYVSGYNTNQGSYLLQLDSGSGAINWQQLISGSTNAEAVSTDATGNAYVLVSNVNEGTAVLKVDVLGNSIWQTVLDGGSNSSYATTGYDAVPDNQGHVYVLGTTQAGSTQYTALFISKLSADTGTMLWSHTIGYSFLDTVNANFYGLRVGSVHEDRIGITGYISGPFPALAFTAQVPTDGSLVGKWSGAIGSATYADVTAAWSANTYPQNHSFSTGDTVPYYNQGNLTAGTLDLTTLAIPVANVVSITTTIGTVADYESTITLTGDGHTTVPGDLSLGGVAPVGWISSMSNVSIVNHSSEFRYVMGDDHGVYAMGDDFYDGPIPYMVKYDTNGAVLWQVQATYDGAEGITGRLIQAQHYSAGNLIALGTYYNFGDGHEGVFVNLVDTAQGSISNVLGITNDLNLDLVPTSITVGPGAPGMGNVYVAGYFQTNSYNNAWLANLTDQSSAGYGDFTNNARFNSVTTDTTGNVYAGGQWFNGNNYEDIVIKTASNLGAPLWGVSILPDAGRTNGAVMADSTGSSLYVTTYNAYATVSKLDAATGTGIWTTQLRGINGGSEGGLLTPDGDVIVAGWAVGPWHAGGPEGMLFTRVSGVDGAVMWSNALYTNAMLGGGNYFWNNNSSTVGLIGTTHFGAGGWQALDGAEGAMAIKLPLDGTGQGTWGPYTYASYVPTVLTTSLATTPRTVGITTTAVTYSSTGDFVPATVRANQFELDRMGGSGQLGAGNVNNIESLSFATGGTINEFSQGNVTLMTINSAERGSVSLNSWSADGNQQAFSQLMWADAEITTQSYIGFQSNAYNWVYTDSKGTHVENYPYGGEGLHSMWQFDNNGALTLPLGSSTAPLSGQIFSPDRNGFINLDVQFASDILGGVRLGSSNAYPVDIVTDFESTANVWRFDNAGNLTLPDGGSVLSNNNLTIQTSEIIYLRSTGAGGVGIYSGNSQLSVTSGLGIETYADAINFTPNAEGAVLIDINNANSFVEIASPVGSWMFTGDGNLSLPSQGNIVSSMGNVNIAGNVVLGSNGNIVFSDSTTQTTAYQVVKSAWNTQYPSVSMGNALFNLDNAGNPTVGAVSGTWTGGYTATYQTAAGSYLSLGTGSASATWTSVASYGIGVTFAAAGDQAIGYFSDNTNGQVYRATWIAGSTGPSTGYGYIQVEQLV